MPSFAAVRHKSLFLIGLAALVAGCSSAPPGGGINDPYEAANRKVHAFNRAIDNAAVRPAGIGSMTIEPGTFDWVVNFSDNASLPGIIVNNILQADVEGASVNTMRFIVNTTIGVGGIVDWATDFGLPEHKTDFGATLAKWGVPEGAYVELPFLGPSTERDAVGEFVDLFLDPLDHVGTPAQQRYALPAKVGEIVVERGDLGATYDSILYDSADSYAQTRLAYLQNRRFELEQSGISAPGFTVDPYGAGTSVDPYAIDPYAEPSDVPSGETAENVSTVPYIDPYAIDPYAELYQ